MHPALLVCSKVVCERHVAAYSRARKGYFGKEARKARLAQQVGGGPRGSAALRYNAPIEGRQASVRLMKAMKGCKDPEGMLGVLRSTTHKGVRPLDTINLSVVLRGFPA